jgi:opacity protein-like surface antigen
MALAGAQRALSYSIGGLFTNPANMATNRVYHLGGLAEIWPEADRFSYGGAAVDSLVNSKGLAGGLGGAMSRQDKDGIDRDYRDLRFALALPFQDKFFVGVGGRYLSLSQDGGGPLGSSRAAGGLAGERIAKSLTFDAGVTIKPAEGFALAVVGNSLSDPGTGFQPLTAGVGLGYAVQQFGVETDLVFDFTTWDETKYRAMGGLEFLVSDSIPLRVGYRYDDGAESHAVSGGLGYLDKTYAAELAVRRVVSGDEATAIVLGFTVHIEGIQTFPSNAF